VTIYCDESGGVGAGVMTLAAVSMAPEAADELLLRMREVVGLRGELKGSRIDLAERAFCIEMLMRLEARAVVVTCAMPSLRAAHGGALPEDIDIYATLLDRAVGEWIAASGGCIAIEIDDGRYDARLNGMLRADVQESLGQWGKAVLADSHRSAGVQIADVLANSFYQIGIGTPKAARIEALLAPFVDAGQIRQIAIERLDAAR
jgi:Protein of unknown function (DUF3800)